MTNKEKDFLLLRLYGTISSWGDVAISVERPSCDHPTKSAVMGMIAASLGIKRDQEAELRSLSEEYYFAVAVHEPGVHLRDYHTILTPYQSALETKSGMKNHVKTRKDQIETAIALGRTKTTISSRDYYCDQCCTVIIWAKNPKRTPAYSMELIQKKLKEPEFVLYLGRKACPLGLPVESHILTGEVLEDVLRKAEFKTHEFLSTQKWMQTNLYWEGESHIVPIHTIIRKDQTISRIKGQFANRTENFAILEGI